MNHPKEEKKKVSLKLLILCAVLGGMIPSLGEMAYMARIEHSMPDAGFLIGLLVSGTFGAVALFIAGAETIRTALMSGISAPQLLGLASKTVATGAQVVSMLCMPVAYADSVINPKLVSDLTIITKDVSFFKSPVSLKISKDSSIVLKDTIKIQAQCGDSLTVVGTDFSKSFKVPAKGSCLVRIDLNQKKFLRSFTRGLMAQQGNLFSTKVNISIE